MTPKSQENYAALDQPRVLSVLFHPRKQFGRRSETAQREDLHIDVSDGATLGASCHISSKKDPMVLFFHGNGEIVSDYDDLGQIYTRRGINFFAVDYRGYGDSSGEPTVAAMMADCHKVLDFVAAYQEQNGFSRELYIMGRSLGSASAIELAARRQKEINGLIVESGFAYAGPLLSLLGVDPDQIGYREEEGFENIGKIKTVSKPSLVIHAEYDHIIPFSDGQALFEAAGSEKKIFLKIENANHNDIFFQGLETYMDHIDQLLAV